MMKKCISILILLAVLTSLVGCLPIPTAHFDAVPVEIDYLINPEVVLTEYVTLDGYVESHTPPEYNKTFYKRYYSGLKPPKTIVILVPGLLAGANVFDVYARKLVASNESLEVWSHDRRSNGLEDREYLVKALENKDPEIAYNYYIENLKKPDGFMPKEPKDYSFMGYWGKDVHLQDLHIIVEKANSIANKVILGGHSLGGTIVGIYSAYDTDRNILSTVPGYHFLDGLLFLDGMPGRTGTFGEHYDTINLGPFRIIDNVEKLEGGEVDPFFSAIAVSGLSDDLISIYAQLAPKGASPFASYGITNRAYVGINQDDNFSFSTIFGASMGYPIGADLSGNILSAFLDGTWGLTSSSIEGVQKGVEMITWGEGDSEDELTDIDVFIDSRLSLDTDSMEWYFPLRLALDLVNLDITLEDTAGFVPTATVPTQTLAIGAAKGLMPTLKEFAAYINVRFGMPIITNILPGTHNDMLYSDNDLLIALTNRWLTYIQDYQPIE